MVESLKKYGIMTRKKIKYKRGVSMKKIILLLAGFAVMAASCAKLSAPVDFPVESLMALNDDNQKIRDLVRQKKTVEAEELVKTVNERTEKIFKSGQKYIIKSDCPIILSEDYLNFRFNFKCITKGRDWMNLLVEYEGEKSGVSNEIAKMIQSNGKGAMYTGIVSFTEPETGKGKSPFETHKGGYLSIITKIHELSVVK